MEGVEANPKDIIQPKSSAEKIASFFQKGSVTKDLILRLSDLDTTIALPNGNETEITLDDVGTYITREVNFIKTYYPSGYRYNPQVEANRKQTATMERLFKKGKYRGLIKLMLEQAVKKWNIADAMDKRVQEMTPEERAEAEELYEGSVKKEAEISRRERETGKKLEHGIAPSLLVVGGDSDRRESRVFLAYATVLAKEIINKEKAV